MKHRQFIFDSLGVVKAVILVALAAMCFPVMASDNVVQSLDNDTTRREDVFVDYESQPSFRGGYNAMIKFLQENVVYPPEAVKDSVQGKVIVQFLIDPGGYVGDVKVVRSVREDLDAEAVRVVKMMPRFSPARWFGKTVSSRFILPVTFRMTDGSDLSTNSVEFGPYLQSDFASDEENCFEEPDVLPEFPGGLDALMYYLGEHIRYPVMAKKNKVQGRVVVRFVVQKTGKVGRVEVLESVDKDLAEEAVRVVKSLPDFTPGLVNDEPVNVWFTLPINFKL